MEIAIFLVLMGVYVLLSNVKFAQQRHEALNPRRSRRQEIVERHARWRRNKAAREKKQEEGTHESATSSCCA